MSVNEEKVNKDRLKGIFIDEGTGSDIDEAFEDAVDTSRIEYGLSGLIPSIATSSIDEVIEQDNEVSTKERVKLLISRSESNENVTAWKYANDSQFKKKKVNVKIENDLNVGFEIGNLLVNEALENELLTLMKEQNIIVDEGFVLESVEVKSYRARYKSVAEHFKGKNKNTFVVKLENDTEILATGETAALAKKEAQRLIKEGALKGKDAYNLEVTLEAKRETNDALIKVQRVKLSQKATLKLTFVALKKPDVKIDGYLFSKNV